jgi:oxygen-independent coproporphyrinogen-3 oxidase
VTWAFHPELLATPVPRYTSYPTAAEFHDGIGASEIEAALAGVGEADDVSLYVHIPYCHEICWYCGCNTGAANRGHRLAAYLDALHAEIALVAGRLGGRGRVGRIAFGGGSPNAIAPSEFLRLVDALRGSFGAEDAPLSVELDPRSLTEEWFDAMKSAGVGMASMGVQTLDPGVQAAIGRIQPEALIRRSVEGLRAARVASINFDLMYGLPGQSAAILDATLAATLAMRPERIALFGYAHVPHLIPRQKRIDATHLPSAAERFEQARMGFERLTRAGYEPIGFDHFALSQDPLAGAARAGRLRRNFQGFTDDPAGILIGLGASAISQFPRLLAQNEKNAGRYRMLASAGKPTAVRGIARGSEDQARGRLIETLLCRGAGEAGALLTPAVAERLAAFDRLGLVRRTGSRLAIEAEGRPYARTIASLFDTYRQPGGRSFSSAI